MNEKLEFQVKHRSKTIDEIELIKRAAISNDLMINRDMIIESCDELIEFEQSGHGNSAIEFDFRLAQYYFNKKNNAEQRGIPFRLTLDEFRALLEAKSCYYTGLTMVDGDPTSPFRRTIERKDNNIGYTAANCVAVTAIANKLKNELFEHPGGEYRLDYDAFEVFFGKMKVLRSKGIL